jgi:hypothetical protein
MHDLKEVLEPYGEAIRLIHEASLFLEMAFRRTHDTLRTAQCELPLTVKHSDRLRVSQGFITESLCKIYLIQETCADARKLCANPPKNGHE